MGRMNAGSLNDRQMASFDKSCLLLTDRGTARTGSRLCKNARLDWGSQFSAVTEELVMM